MTPPSSAQTSVPPLPVPALARPVLSLCMMGRDDDYMPDFRYRLVATVDFMARQLAQLGALDQVEILVADWASETPMSQTLEFSEESTRICRFLYLSPQQLELAGYRPDSLQPPAATNAAVRRAAGEFVVQIGADTLLPMHALDYLLRLCRGEVAIPTDRTATLFLIPRVQVPWQFTKRQPSVGEWEYYLLMNSSYLPLGTPHNQANGGDAGAILMHRRLWSGCRGLSEKLQGWGWNDCDLASRICQTLPWMTLSGLGVVSIHMEHEPNAGRRARVPAIGMTAWGRTFPHTTQVVANSDDWGFEGIGLPTAEARVARGEDLGVGAEGKGAKFALVDGPGLLCELQDNSLLTAVSRALAKFVEKRLTGRECLEEGTALSLLGWYAAHRYPRRFVDVGVRRHGASVVVGALCPSVEIYGADRWDGDVEYVATPGAIAAGLEAAGHRGYLHFLNGDPQTSVARIAGLMPSSRSADLVYVREGCLGAGFADTVSLALDLLAPGGALVFRAASRQSAERLWQQLWKQPGLSAMFCASDAFTGMVFAAAGGEPRVTTEPLEIGDAGEGLRWHEVSPALLWQIVRACKHPGRPDQLLRRALRCFFRTGFTRPRT